ncbi:MAG: sugar kinase [Oscillospiraceae bacterium]
MNNKAFDLITLGEIMLRLSTPSNERLQRGDIFEKRAGGSELNVASGVSLLGLRTGVISKLPDNAMGTYIKNRIRFVGVSDDYLIYDKSDDARLGIYYYENGAAPRKPSIVYDRKGASINRISLDELPSDVYESTRCFHTSGITLALSPQLRTTAIELMRRFKQSGAMLSFDVNYRANLWSEQDALCAIKEILPLIDVLFVSEETSRRMFAKEGELCDIMQSYCTEYGIKLVATTQRIVKSPRKHSFGSVIYDSADGKFYKENPYEDIDVVDRIGSGDAYVAGVLFGLLKYGETQKALEFGNATAAVKNTIPGDLPSSDYKEISAIIASHTAKGPVDELNR